MHTRLKLAFPLSLALLLALAAPALSRADSVIVGQLVYSATSGSAQIPGFTVYNYTGPMWGSCDPLYGPGVCSEVDFTDTSLSVTFANGATITSSPNYVFTPGGYLYGDNFGDDVNNSFEFDTAALGEGDIVSYAFSGTLSAPSFTLDNGSAFVSSGALGMVDEGGGEVDLVANAVPSGNTVPEPGTWWLLATGLAGLGWFWRRRTAAHS